MSKLSIVESITAVGESLTTLPLNTPQTISTAQCGGERGWFYLTSWHVASIGVGLKWMSKLRNG